jgi:putative ABC transport system permease protein
MLESLLRDVRYGARLLRASPFFTLVSVASVGAGLTAALGVFTIVNAAVFRPIGTAAAADLYRLYTSDRGGKQYGAVSYADYRDFARATDVFAGMCATKPVRANVFIEQRGEMRSGAVVSPGCLGLLGVRPAAGRLLAPVETGSPEVVISYPMWRSRFAADPTAVGRQILLNGVSVTVVGVAPRGFNGTSFDGSADFWIDPERLPALLPARALTHRGYRGFTVYARLRDGVKPAQAEAALAGMAAGLAQADGAAWIDDAGAVRRVTVARETDSRFASTPGIVELVGVSTAAGIAGVLAIACVNVATLLLARGASRTRELAIRLAVGATRGRVLRQLAVESFLISALGVVAAAATVAVGIRLFEAYRPDGVPAFNIALDWRVATFAVFAATLASLMFGLLPGLHTVKVALADGLKGRPSSLKLRRFRAGLREMLIVVQVAASVALLLATSVFARAMARGAMESPGFNADGVAVLYVDMGTLDGRRVPELTDRIMRAIGETPGVDTASIGAMLPLTGGSTTFRARVEGEDRALEGNVISPGYLAVMRIPLRAGRDFSSLDAANTRPVAIASETLARTIWHTPDAVGRTLDVRGHTVEIVGVAADTRYRAVNEPFRPVIYLPISQLPVPDFYVHARAIGGETLAAMDRAARSVHPAILIDTSVPLAARLDDMRAPERAAQWVGAAGGIAQFLLVLMALWALVAYAVARRTREIGIRIALGATGSEVVGLVLRPALVLVATGAIAGAAIGVAATIVLQSEFVGLGELEPLAGIPVLVAVTMVAAAALLVPARRAASVEPVVALRAE